MAGNFLSWHKVVTMTFMLTVGLYHAEAALKRIFVDDICHSRNSATVYLKDVSSGILMGTSHDEPLDCSIILAPRPGLSVILSIYRYELESEDSLMIEDADNHKFSLMGWREFPTEKKSIISEGSITIHYVRGNHSSGYPKPKFQFTFTQAGNAPCYFNEFECKNEKCIPQSLACDEHNHCGDNSDQIKCVPKAEVEVVSPSPELHYAVTNSSSIWIISIVVCGIVLFVVTVTFFVAVIRNARQKKASASSANPEDQVSNNGNQKTPPSAHRDPQPLSASNLQSSVDVEVQPTHQRRPSTIFNQIRRSLKSHKSRNADELKLEQSKTESYQVPSLYPDLDQIPTAPELDGEDNSSFKIEE